MKIVSIGPAHPLRGGIAKFNESLASSLVAAGNHVDIFSYRFQYPSILFPGTSQYTKSPPPEGLNIEALVHSLSMLNWSRVASEVVSRQPDLVIIHYWMPFFAPAMGYISGKLRKHGITVILLAHNLIPHESQSGPVILTRWLLRHVDGLVTLSASVKEDALKIRKGIPALVIPHPLYDNFGEKAGRGEAIRHLSLDESKKYILFFGLVRKYKGLDILLKALPLFADPDIVVIVAGEFYEKKVEYTTLIDELEMSDRVVISDGYIPDEDVRYYFSAAELVVQPYRSATQSGVTQIAYSFEIPMVVSDVGGLPEIVDNGRTGYVVKAIPEAVAAAVNTFFASGAQSEMIENVRKRKNDFTWESFVKKFITFAGDLIK